MLMLPNDKYICEIARLQGIINYLRKEREQTLAALEQLRHELVKIQWDIQDRNGHKRTTILG